MIKSFKYFLIILLICSLNIISSRGEKNNTNKKSKKNLISLKDMVEDNEEIIFGFKTIKSGKCLVICVSSTTPEYIIYKYGKPDKIEFEYPKNKTEKSWSKFKYYCMIRPIQDDVPAIDEKSLSFNSGNYTYKVYEEFDNDKNIFICGIRVKNNKTEKTTDIKGDWKSKIGSFDSLKFDDRLDYLE